EGARGGEAFGEKEEGHRLNDGSGRRGVIAHKFMPKNDNHTAVLLVGMKVARTKLMEAVASGLKHDGMEEKEAAL
ncbi:serine/threonine-protein phosphatase 7 long form-like protein, partial [Sesbania bispinosa]